MLDMVLKDMGKTLSEKEADKLWNRLCREGGVSFEITTAEGTFSVEIINV